MYSEINCRLNFRRHWPRGWCTHTHALLQTLATWLVRRHTCIVADTGHVAGAHTHMHCRRHWPRGWCADTHALSQTLATWLVHTHTCIVAMIISRYESNSEYSVNFMSAKISHPIHDIFVVFFFFYSVYSEAHRRKEEW